MKYGKLAAAVSALVTPALMGLKAGDPAPEFTAKNQDGKIVHLSEYRGKPVVLYFYPKDETPGCTKEACSFRDEFAKFRAAGAVVLGVSKQDEKSHQAFRSKHQLPFDLLVDSDGALAKLYGVKQMPVIGFFKRETVLIGPDGKVAKFYEDVDPSKHADELLKDIQSLKQS